MSERDQSDAPVGPATAGPTGPDRPRWVAPVGIGLVVLLTAALVAVVHFGIGAIGGVLTARDRADAVSSARAAAVNLTTYEGENAEEDVQRLLSTATPDYAAAFAGDQDLFVKNLRDNKVKMTGTVTEAGLSEYDGSKAAVVLAVKTHQEAGGPNSPEQDLDYRMLLRMEKVGGDWLMARTEFVE